MPDTASPIDLPLPREHLAALLFDLDGTLIDTRAINRIALAAVFRPFGLELATLPRPPEGTAFIDWVAHLVDNGSLPADVDTAALWRHCEREVIERATQAPAIGPVVALARWAGAWAPAVPTAVATGSSRVVAESLLAASGLDDLFGVLVTRDEVSRGKPAPDLFLAAAEQLGVPPSGCVVVEDTDIGLSSARSAGMATLDVRPFRET
ncbi:HAD family hydrolase [Kutzneria albida]|uniref:Uncharacterized protein n=1 Tax=Kutzneria albida DSM 43870 TaxID=1449976 RepID=W5W3N3_9PSEU|nr:HAD family phosphatase [Kutzneria albida]AHH95390.1 hypothetical protein KALB_2021 [Kutzneria albida DSM 43870]